jgi:hypothetical protein
MDDKNAQGEPVRMDARKDDTFEPGDEGEALAALRELAVSSPPHTFQRFRRRATVVQGTRMLFESQVTGFWIVLDAFLRLALGGSSIQPEATASQRDEA